MIRKFIIVMLTLAAVTSGAIGILSGSGRTSWSYTLWSSGEYATPGSRNTALVWGTSRRVMINHLEWLDANATASQKRYSGLGWLYDESVVLNEETGNYARSTMLIVSFFVPILLALASSIYPTLFFLRGPLRRYRRRKRGLCVTCGYDMRRSPERCPECGAGIERAS